MKIFQIIIAFIMLSILIQSCNKEQNKKKDLILSGFFLSQSSKSRGPIFYVDSENGNDSNDGLSQDKPWKSLDKVNTSTTSGATVLFRRGGIWRGQLKPVSGSSSARTIYGAYSSGEKPVFLGSINNSSSGDWTAEGGNVWLSSSTFTTDIGNIIFNNATSFGNKKWNLTDCTSQGDYYYNRDTGELRIYSTSNPAIYYSSIELALRKHIIDQQGSSYITYENLSIKYGSAHGFGGGNTSHLIIRDCEISYIGGGDLHMDGQNIRFGNGIEFWGNAENNLVERNRIREIYDSGLTNQNHTQTVTQSNITYRNNLIWNCAMSCFEYWNRPESSVTSNIRFENNTCVNSGSGWGKPPQRPDLQGVHVLLTFNPAKTSGLYIRNNIFYEGNLSLYVQYASQWQNSLDINYNCYYKSSGNMIRIEDQSLSYTMSEFSGYQNFSKKDTNSLIGDPLFISLLEDNFILSNNSPCIDSGLNTDNKTDFSKNTRPIGNTSDIGAYEQ